MGIYTAAVTTPAPAAGAAFCAINTPASKTIRIKEIGIFSTVATASSIQVIRPANTPVATTNVLGQAQDSQLGASVVNVSTAWSTAPTITAMVPLRRIVLPATISAGMIWTFPDPIVLAISSWLILWNFGAGAAPISAAYFVWDE